MLRCTWLCWGETPESYFCSFFSGSCSPPVCAGWFVIVFVLCVMGMLWGISTPGHSWSSNIQHFNCSRLHLLMLYFQGNKLKETLLPSLNLLTESARIHRDTRKFLRMKVRLDENSTVNLMDFNFFFFGNESVWLCVYAGASTITRCQKQTWGRERSTKQASASNDTHRHGCEALCGWVPVCAVQGEWYVTLLLKIHKITGMYFF